MRRNESLIDNKQPGTQKPAVIHMLSKEEEAFLTLLSGIVVNATLNQAYDTEKRDTLHALQQQGPKQ